jgi:hypothetical protein
MHQVAEPTTLNMVLNPSFLVLLLLASGANAFFSLAAKKSASSVLTDQAIQIFAKEYPFGRPPVKTNPLVDFGMPNRDLDRTKLKKVESTGKRLTDISEEQAKASFAQLAKLYGGERALDVVTALPICLAFDSKLFAGSLKAWSEIFGPEEAKEMVRRNPGLLAVRPTDAASATDTTMKFSYLVAYTRPLGPVGLPLLFVLLLTPAIEFVTGIPIRSAFLGGL